MTNQLRTFEAPALGNLNFTVWDRECAPWFIAKEVLDVLGLKGTGIKTIIASLADDEKDQANLNNLQTLKGIRSNPNRWFVSESGLYKLIMRSNKPEAAQFQDWVTKVVLPAIRKDGAYIESEEKLATGELSEEEFVFKAMEIMQGKIERLKAANQKRFCW
ncbi:MAG: hypothetical protein JXQ85_12730 [Cognatishimia sp.]|uniref:BRO-N domain-containing protein n=1 Tax=Cognatishimia sp. TaxID=2211648 RepID=UPI003B8DC0E9